MDEIKVSVVKFTDKPYWMLRAVNYPTTGKTTHKSSKILKSAKKSKSDAAKLAGVWQEELRSGVVQESNISWANFRERYERDVLESLKETTDLKAQGRLNAVEKYLKPELLRDITSERLSYLQSELRKAGLAETTIKGHLVGIMAALNWAVRIGYLSKAPKVDLPKRAKGSKMMKGRAITTEEFERMLAVVPKILDNGQEVKNPAKVAQREADKAEAIKSWQHYLRGLWLSGLRLTESLELTWDDESKLRVDMQPGAHPMLHIPGELQKSGQDQLYPMAPEFAEFLGQTPEAERTGYVFNPLASRKCGPRLKAHRVSEIVTDIGEKANVVVNKEQGKFASAHDLRRSFGERWASRVMPQVLMELMRHSSIDTTMRYYIGRNSQATAAVLWQAHNSLNSNGSSNGTTSGGKGRVAEYSEKQASNQ